jgi:hypothetical protein
MNALTFFQKSRMFFSLTLCLVLLLVLAFPAMAAGPASPGAAPGPDIPEAVLLLIPALVGGIGIPVINRLKLALGWTTPEDKNKNLWLAFGVSMALAILALLLTNSFLPLGGPDTVVAWITLAFSVATLIYKSLPAPDKSDAPVG